MANRLALMGASDGPWVDVSRVANPSLRVTNLPSGGLLTIQLKVPVDGQDELADVSIQVDENGEHPMPRATWAQISCNVAKLHKTLCVFVQKQMVA